MSVYRNPHAPISDVHASPRVGAKPTLESTAPPVETKPPTTRELQMRKAQPSNTLLPHTKQWAAKLPQDLQPNALMRDFPRIANMIALLWTESSRTPLDNYMDSLLVNRRSNNRQGFPPAVAVELISLRGAFEDRHRLR